MNEIEDLVKFFEETPFGEDARAEDLTVNEVLEYLGQDRTFFRLAGLDYARPNFNLIETAIILYRQKVQNAKN